MDRLLYETEDLLNYMRFREMHPDHTEIINNAEFFCPSSLSLEDALFEHCNYDGPLHEEDFECFNGTRVPTIYVYDDNQQKKLLCSFCFPDLTAYSEIDLLDHFELMHGIQKSYETEPIEPIVGIMLSSGEVTIKALCPYQLTIGSSLCFEIFDWDFSTLHRFNYNKHVILSHRTKVVDNFPDIMKQYNMEFHYFVPFDERYSAYFDQRPVFEPIARKVREFLSGGPEGQFIKWEEGDWQ